MWLALRKLANLRFLLKERDWLRGPDLNRRPSGYEPDELPSCSTPRPTCEQLYAQQGVLQVCKHGAERGTRTLTPKR